MQFNSRENVEQIVTAVWKEVLQLQVLGRDDDLLDVGGASILAELIASKLQETLEIELTGSDVLRHPTVAQLSGQIETALADQK
jgi:hypothetical protein